MELVRHCGRRTCTVSNSAVHLVFFFGTCTTTYYYLLTYYLLFAAMLTAVLFARATPPPLCRAAAASDPVARLGARAGDEVSVRVPQATLRAPPKLWATEYGGHGFQTSDAAATTAPLLASASPSGHSQQPAHNATRHHSLARPEHQKPAMTSSASRACAGDQTITSAGAQGATPPPHASHHPPHTPLHATQAWAAPRGHHWARPRCLGAPLQTPLPRVASASTADPHARRVCRPRPCVWPRVGARLIGDFTTPNGPRHAAGEAAHRHSPIYTPSPSLAATHARPAPAAPRALPAPPATGTSP